MTESLTNQIKSAIDKTGTDIDLAMLQAFIEVESGGKGFDPKTGKILIQFEPSWFKRKAPYAPSGKWSVNSVDVQSREWPAFNEAFRLNPEAAMESTSIGLPQIMGFHWKRLGYESVGAMWDDFKESVVNQISALITFIETDRKLKQAMIDRDFHIIAMRYNGAGYMALAYKYGRDPYNISLQRAYEKYRSLA